MNWQNKAFDEVHFNLELSYLEYGYLNCDLQIIANNNLFKRGYINMQPVPASAGNWAFRDNVFDQVTLWQDTLAALDNDHNGYTPGSATLTGSVGNDVKLLQPLTYQTGTFGNYYLSSQTPLYQAGSQTAGNAGLAQYTTLTSQAKEVASKPVSIGFHYIAANGTKSLDTDNDGVPDCLEDANGNGLVDAGETDLSKPKTDGVTPDASNPVYDNVDLSGNGLVGRIKKVFSQNPLDTGNPFTVKQIITGGEPDIFTYEVPLRHAALTNFGTVRLKLDGVEVKLSDVIAGTNGNAWIIWNTTYDAPGFHYMQPQLDMYYSEGTPGVYMGMGTLTSLVNSNVLQFFEGGSMYDDTGAYLDAKLVSSNATYTIQIFDPSTTPPTFLKGITNSTSNGMIQEDWNLIRDDGTKFTGKDFNAVFSVTPAAAARPSQNTKKEHELTTNEQGNGFDVVYFYSSTNNLSPDPYGNPNKNPGAIWLGMQNVVDTLLMPQTWGLGGHDNFYISSFNNYTSQGNNYHGNGTSQGWPGYASSQAVITNSVNGLLNSLADGTTKNFYCYAHGSTNWVGNHVGDTYLMAVQVSDLLRNNFSATNGPDTKNPYRFVFLDGCSITKNETWRQAFGIYSLGETNLAERSKVGPQAFVGWVEDHWGWMNIEDNQSDSLAIAAAYTVTIANFYNNWMNKATLAQCIDMASTTNNGQAPFPVPQNKNVTLLVKDPNNINNLIRFPYTNIHTSPIRVIGHSGLKRDGVDTRYDGQYP